MTRSLLRYVRSHHLALIALLLAMGSTAYAADSIRGRDVVDGSLKGKDLKNESIQGRDIEDGSLNGSHIDESTLEDRIQSATVAINSNGFLELESADGFETVKAPAPGLYELTTSPGASTECDFATTFVPGNAGAADQVLTLSVNPLGSDTVLVRTRGADGQPVAVGGDSGVDGFSLVANCRPSDA